MVGEMLFPLKSEYKNNKYNSTYFYCLSKLNRKENTEMKFKKSESWCACRKVLYRAHMYEVCKRYESSLVV